MCDKCVNHCHENKGCGAKYKAVHGFKSRLNGKLLAEDGILPIEKAHELAAVLSDAYTFLLIDDGVRVEIVKASAFGTQVKIERGVGQTVPSDFNVGACVVFEVFDFGQGDCSQSHSDCACHDDVNDKGAVRVIAPVDYRVNVHFNVNHSGDLTKVGQGLVEILGALISAINSNNSNNNNQSLSGTGSDSKSDSGSGTGSGQNTGSSDANSGSSSTDSSSSGGSGGKVFVEKVSSSSSSGSSENNSSSSSTSGGSNESSGSRWHFDATTVLPRR